MSNTVKQILTNLALCVIFTFVLIIVAAFKSDTSKNVTLEIPQIQSSVPGKVVHHTGYTVSFNSDWRIPNWVAYELTAEEVAGVEPRSNNFVPDPDIFNCPSSDIYKNSGYDRGHMAPAGDMKWSKKAMEESFYMSNICPQNHNLNGGDWKDLEEHIRSMATKYDHIYICCGPIMSENPIKLGIGNPVLVPSAFYKAILRQKGDSWTAIGFMMPNKAGHKALATYAMTIDDLEKETQIDFFYTLPDSIEEIVESTYNLADWDLKAPKAKTKKSTPKPTTTKAPETKPAEEVVAMEQVEALPIEPAAEVEAPSKPSTSTTKSSSYTETYNGHVVYTGPRGGKYYYNSKGKKVYIKR